MLETSIAEVNLKMCVFRERASVGRENERTFCFHSFAWLSKAFDLILPDSDCEQLISLEYSREDGLASFYFFFQFLMDEKRIF